MADQLFQDGKVISVDGVDLECVAVSYQEVDGEKSNFGYTFRAKAELDAEREEQARREAEAAEAEAQTEANSVPVTEQTNEGQEETQHVK